jgi:hypothetical protein
MVARLDFWSVSLAQKPKSAVGGEEAREVTEVSNSCIVETTPTNNFPSGLTYLDLASRVKKHVVTLDISVDNLTVVQMLETTTGLWRASRDAKVQCSAVLSAPYATTHLQADRRNLILLHLVLLNHVRQSAALHKLHDHPEVRVLDEESLEKVDNVRVSRLAHNEDLVDYQLLAGLLS